MTKRRIITLTISLVIIVTSNIYSGYINVFTEGLFKSYLYQTGNAEFEFWAVPSKGRDEKMMQLKFNDFKNQNIEFSNLRIYRTFKRNPLKFWNWYDYLTNERYNYPFKEKIEKEKTMPNRVSSPASN